VALVSTRIAVASVGVTALVVVTVWLTDLSFERAILLAPVLVIGVAAAAGLLVFWGRVGWESFRSSRRPRVVAALVLGFVLLLVALTLLGVDLPREGG
jgi:integral membrane sensor domain MASE1